MSPGIQARFSLPRLHRAILLALISASLVFAPISADQPDRQSALLRLSGVAWYKTRTEYTEIFDFPASNQRIYAAKVLDQVSGKVNIVYLDQALRPVDFLKARRDELEAYNKLHGKRHHLLTERLQRAARDSRIPVGIWLAEPDTTPAVEKARALGHDLIGGRPSGPRTREALEVLTSEKMKIYRMSNAPVAAAVRAMGGDVDYVSELAPLVFATLTPPQIAQVERLPSVERIYTAPGLKAQMASVNPAVQNAAMKAAGHTGNANIKVGIVDAVSQVDFANPYLNHLAGLTRPGGLPEVDDHATSAAGIIASKKEAADPAYPPGAADGIAPNVKILSADMREPLDQAIIDGPVGNGRADTAVAAGSDDQQVISVGGAPGIGSVIIAPGPDGVLNTVPAADDVRAGTVFEPWAGGNGKADTPKMGDDVQVIPFGNAAAPGAVIVSAGPNHVLDTNQFGVDDLPANEVNWDLMNPAFNFAPAYDFVAAADWAIGQGAAVLNMSIGEVISDLTFDVTDRYVDHVVFEHFRAVVVAADNDCGAIIEPDTGGNGIADTPKAGDDVQVFPVGSNTAGGKTVRSRTEIVHPGPDGVLDTAPAPRVYEPTAGGNGRADTTAAGDDVQVIPVGNAAVAGATVVSPGADGVLDSAKAGDDIAADDIDWVDAGWACGVSSPGLAYNAITVGAIDDLNTAALGDDQRSFFSCWRDLPGDHEKPELSAPGSRIITTAVVGGANDNAATGTGGAGGHANGDGVSNFGEDGTSFAAPAVTGLLANMFHMDAALISWPEATKAIAIASAKRNVYDNAIENLGGVNWDPREGAGTIVIDEAHEIIMKGHYAKNVVGAANFPRSRTVRGIKDKILRYAIAWPSHASGGPPFDINNDALTADLDLEVHDAAGNLVAWSRSFNNGYEVVSFIVPATQNYEVTILAPSFTGPNEFLGEAWNAEDPVPANQIPVLSSWGLVALVTALLLSGLIALAWRQRWRTG